ncbi:MAG: hypothetical protein LBL69_05480 [Zoogloeaceae bacterium]|nr:hypothetical protein [Zoogloeaceae bacterium]
MPIVWPDATIMHRRAEDFLRLSEEVLSYRAQAIAFYQQLAAKKAQKQPISGADRLLINEGAVELLSQRERLLAVALPYECWMRHPLDTAHADVHRLGAYMALSAGLMLYDNYLSAISLFAADPDLRQLANESDSALGLSARELQKSELLFVMSKNRWRMKRAIDWVKKNPLPKDETDPLIRYLALSIHQSPSFQQLANPRPFKRLAQTFNLLGGMTLDALFRLQRDTLQLSSLVFGNSVGLVEFRRGKLYDDPPTLQTFTATLQAGDVLLEKTPFRLTDTLIPGHWGHAAIWVGSEAELKALGLWDAPEVVPHQEAIRAGKGVVEALRSGVEMNTAAHFLNVDDLAVLRPANRSEAERKAAILTALGQVGKAYDFNFNAESADKMFCSKLVYLAYGKLDWPTSRMLGRFTVSPDDIARRALQPDHPLTITLLFHDGKQITTDKEAAMTRLLDGEKSPAPLGPPQQLCHNLADCRL